MGVNRNGGNMFSKMSPRTKFMILMWGPIAVCIAAMTMNASQMSSSSQMVVYFFIFVLWAITWMMMRHNSK